MGAITHITAERSLAMPVTVRRCAADIETLSASTGRDPVPLLPAFHCPVAGLFVDPSHPVVRRRPAV